MTAGRVGRTLRIGEAAAIIGVSTTAVADWADKGLIPHFKTPGGQRRFRREDVEQFLKSQEPAA